MDYSDVIWQTYKLTVLLLSSKLFLILHGRYLHIAQRELCQEESEVMEWSGEARSLSVTQPTLWDSKQIKTTF